MIKLFIKNSIVFMFITAIAYISIYLIIDSFLNHKEASKNNIFIWGDSQTVQGLNLTEISRLTTKNIYSAAQHGAGLYHFLLFSEKVPRESHIILGISELTQIRPIDREFNRSTIGLFPMIELYNSPIYNNNTILSIINNNKYPTKIFKSNNLLYPSSDTIIIKQPLSLFLESYKSMSNQTLQDRQTLLLLGIKKLISKRCKITFVEFPIHSSLFNTIQNVSLKERTESFEFKIMELFDNFKIDSIHIDNSKNMMYDFTHLNEYGATLTTKALIEKMKINGAFTTMYTINEGVCR